MKNKIIGIVPLCLGIIAMGLVCTAPSHAIIDIDTVEGLWMFDDDLADGSPNGLEGDFTGGGNRPKYVNGVFGKALEFDGSGGYVEIPEHPNPSVAISVSLWVKSATPTWNQHGWMVEKRDAYMMHPVLGEVNVGWIVCNGVCWNQPGAWTDGKAGPNDITEWHMYTGTFDSKTGDWKLYVDAEEISTLDRTKAEVVVDNGVVNIGFDSCCDGRPGEGLIDEVAIFNVALTEDQVKEIFEGFEVALAVQPTSKLTTTWGQVKVQ